MDVEIAAPRRAADGRVHIELVGRAFPREAAQTAQRHLDIPGAEFDRIVQIPELALLPHLDGALVLAFAADAHTRRIVAVIAEGGGAAGADPFIAALMAMFLFLQTLLERLHNLVPVAQRLDLFHFLGRQIFFRHSAQPFLRNVGAGHIRLGEQALEHAGENLVEPVDQPFVLHVDRAGKIIELFGRPVDRFGLQRIKQDQMLLDRSGDTGAAQRIEKIQKHKIFYLPHRQDASINHAFTIALQHESGMMSWGLGNDMALDKNDFIVALGEQCGDVTLQCSDVAGFLNLVNARTRQDLESLTTVRTVMAELDLHQKANAQAAMELMITAEHADGMVRVGHRAAEDSLHQVAGLINHVTGLDDRLHAFLSMIEAVGGISEALSAIVKQTRMLGFNAAIEASRGGQAAQGFAVVAEEMRRLADVAGQQADMVGVRLADLDQSARLLIEGVQENIAKGRSTSTHLDTIRTLMEDFAALISQFHERSNAIADCTRAAGAGVESLDDRLTRFSASVTENAGRLEDARDRIDRLEGFANDMLNGVAHAGIETRNSPFIAMAQQGAARVMACVEAALDAGQLTQDMVFDRNYQPVMGSDPQQFLTRFVPFADHDIRPILDAETARDGAIVGCCLIDMNGHLPTHISARSKTQRVGERQWNVENSRNRQIFMDNQTRRALDADGAFFLNTYRQDFGDGEYRALRSVFVPLTFAGQRWGLYELGYLI